MPMHMPTHRIVARAAALFLVAGLALGSSATASEAASFDLRTGAKTTSGRAHAYGRLTFPTSRSIRVRGRFDDECSAAGKGDGYAAYIQIDIVVRGGRSFRVFGRDERGCTRAPIRMVFDQAVPADIESVRILVLKSKPDGDSYSYDDIREPVSKRIVR